MNSDEKNDFLFQLVSNGDMLSLSKQPEEDLINCKDRNDSNLLHYAAGGGFTEICNFLLLILPVESCSTKNKRTGLHWAARNGHTEICRLLVNEYNAKVDSLAKGQVTPLQLAIWQCHLETAKCLVEELGANPHFPNAWGCGIAHWLGKSPIYDETDQTTSERLEEACEWLFQEYQVTYDLPNHHGQTPLHKAAFAGNIVVAKYLLLNFRVIDNVRDNNGNTAADCAERSLNLNVAWWMRRYASLPMHQAIASLGLRVHHRGIMPPSLEDIRTAFLLLAKQYHPDINHTESIINNNTEKWNTIRDAHQFLQGWWKDDPKHFDVQIRIRTRNALLLEYERLCWHSGWHDEQNRKKATTALSANNYSSALANFEYRLIRLLKHDSFLQSGLRISQLPKEYEKNYHAPIPKPREFGCKKLIHLLRQHCPNIVVETDGKKQALLRVVS
jgi:ankyrin repeat protein